MPTANKPLRLLGLSILFLTGCARQDTEILTRVGRKLAGKAQTSTAGLREKVPFRLTTTTAEPALADLVKQRLASDKLLAATSLEVQATGTDVELKGVVDRDDHKRRALDLAESTQGVERVVDSIQIRPEKNAEN